MTQYANPSLMRGLNVLKFMSVVFALALLHQNGSISMVAAVIKE